MQKRELLDLVLEVLLTSNQGKACDAPTAKIRLDLILEGLVEQVLVCFLRVGIRRCVRL